jgi:hypothetical protein
LGGERTRYSSSSLAPAEPEPITGDLGFDDLSILEK